LRPSIGEHAATPGKRDVSRCRLILRDLSRGIEEEFHESLAYPRS